MLLKFESNTQKGCLGVPHLYCTATGTRVCDEPVCIHRPVADERKSGGSISAVAGAFSTRCAANAVEDCLPSCCDGPSASQNPMEKAIRRHTAEGAATMRCAANACEGYLPAYCGGGGGGTPASN